MRTLASICAEHLSHELPLQFLKNDVEGFEEQMLCGMDLRRWKRLILDAGYRFAL